MWVVGPRGECERERTVLVQKQYIAASKIDGVSSAQAGHCSKVSFPLRCRMRKVEYSQPAPTTITLSDEVMMCNELRERYVRRERKKSQRGVMHKKRQLTIGKIITVRSGDPAGRMIDGLSRGSAVEAIQYERGRTDLIYSRKR